MTNVVTQMNVNEEGFIVVDLRTESEMSQEVSNAWEFMQLHVVVEGMTGEQLYNALRCYSIPSDIEDGSYKDYAIESANHLHNFICSIDEVEVLGFSEGPRYWFVKYQYDGEVYSIGPGSEEKIMVYGIHKYWVMNNGSVTHDDSVEEGIVENDDSTWPNKSYLVDCDKLPSALIDADEELAPFILDYHHKKVEKPDWIVED